MCNGNTRRTREQETEGEIFETIMTENITKLISDAKPQVQEAQRTPSRIHTKKLHCIIFKLQSNIKKKY